MMSYLKTLPKRWLILTAIVIILLVSGLLDLSKNETSPHSNSGGIKVFTPDWGIGATLVAMGHPPIAIGSKQNYKVRVHTPKLPDSVADIGLKYGPNLELLAELKPELIMYTPFYKEQRHYYDPTIPIEEINYSSEANQVPQWSTYANSARKIGVTLNEQARTEKYIENSQQRITNAGQKIHHHIGNKKFLVIELLDARETRIITINHPISLALQMMNLDMLSPKNNNSRQNITISTDELHKIFKQSANACLVIIEPTPIITKYEIANSPIWQRSPFLKPDACVYHIDPVWTDGGIEVMVTFANNLEKAVLDQDNSDSEYVSLKQLAGSQR